MEMFSFGFLGGVIVVLIAMGVLVCLDEDIRDRDRSIDDNTIGTSRKRNGVDRPSHEEIENVLYVLRIGASQREKEVIDYLIDKEGSEDD